MSVVSRGVALVTGASRGIGRATAIKLAQEGYHLLINYHKSQVRASEVLEEITSIGGSAELLPFDVTQLEEVEQALTAWQETNRDTYIRVLVNNAGVTDDALLLWLEPSQWQQVVDTSLDGFYNVTHTILKRMVEKRSGRIINITSVSGLTGTPGQTHYSAAKAGVIGATRSLALEVAKRGITVNAVAPGFIRSDMTAHLDERELKKRIPVGRLGEAEEVAALVAFLASDEAGYITGEVVSINGGIYT